MKFFYNKSLMVLLKCMASIVLSHLIFSPDAASALENSVNDEPLRSAEKTTAPSKFYSADDGWLDMSAFIDQAYG